MYAIINYFRKGPVCDDSNAIPVGRVVCRNLGATLINITHYNEGPTSSMYICVIGIMTILGVKHSATVSIHSEYFSFL